MNRVVRCLLVWVMVIAMPLQGMAASMMLFCGASHAPMVVQGPVHDQAAAVHVHPAQVHASDSEAAVPAEAGRDSGHGQSSCSACAACCSMLALPASVLVPDAVGPVHPMQAVVSAALPSQQPDGLDRPPRTVSA